MAPPNLPSKITTPRLTLLRLTESTPLTHPHVQLYHENWSDTTATAWSLHGATHSLQESQEWMQEQFSKYDNIFYAVFTKDVPIPTPQSEEKEDGKVAGKTYDEEMGLHIGSVSLRMQPGGPTISPLAYSKAGGKKEEEGEEEVEIDLRVLGYALFPSAWGKGYATEANRGVIDAYAAAVAASSPQKPSIATQELKAEKEMEAGSMGKKKRFYIEAAVDEDNPGSVNVLRKLGFQKLGWKMEEEKVWLNGGWRGPGYLVYGMYI